MHNADCVVGYLVIILQFVISCTHEIVRMVWI